MTQREAAERVRHDLGKYVHLEARWLDEDATTAELREALVNDLRRTRRGPDGEIDCCTLWERLRPAVAVLDLGAIDAVAVALQADLPRLEALDRSGLLAVAARARLLAEACRRLVDQVRD
ncbi:MAG: hypothetical protein FJ090_14090 [Deltaproteobacteria bacterium]|nr:hypothetical protein [Deltaproteobacteria bacterium]